MTHILPPNPPGASQKGEKSWEKKYRRRVRRSRGTCKLQLGTCPGLSPGLHISLPSFSLCPNPFLCLCAGSRAATTPRPHCPLALSYPKGSSWTKSCRSWGMAQFSPCWKCRISICSFAWQPRISLCLKQRRQQSPRARFLLPASLEHL